MMSSPRIGRLTIIDRLLGWRDLRCRCCGMVCGCEKPAGGSTVWCAECSSVYALAAIL